MLEFIPYPLLAGGSILAIALCARWRRTGNLPDVTGAKHPVVLGKFVP